MPRLVEHSLAAVVIGVPAIAIAVAVVGCGASGAETGRDEIELAQLKTKVIDILCDFQVRCGLSSDRETCAAILPIKGLFGLVPVVIGFNQRVALVNAGKIKYDGVAAAACLAAVRDRLDSCSAGSFARGEDPQPCQDTFRGTLAIGESCFTNEECVSPACDMTRCKDATTCCAGICSASPVAGQLGGDCDDTGSLPRNCALGSFCGFTQPYRCERPTAVGGPCGTREECPEGTICLFDTLGSGRGICTQLPGQGKPCLGTEHQCDLINDYCREGLCAPKGMIGTPCPALGGDSTCAFHEQCDPATLTCQPLAGVGGACTRPDDCIPDLDCSTSGQCAIGVASATTAGLLEGAVCP